MVTFLVASQVIIFIGSPGRARTADPVINSHLLYQLSYRGTLRRILQGERKSVKKLLLWPTSCRFRISGAIPRGFGSGSRDNP